jgi:hypothetical protein
MKIKANIHDAVHNPASLRPSLTIDKSDIEGAGDGLFCTEFIGKGFPICEYKGDMLSQNGMAERANQGADAYILMLGDPAMAGLNGEFFSSIDAHPENANEIGYGGFANDLYTDYPKDILDLIKEQKKETIKFRDGSSDYINSIDWNKKLPKEDRRKVKKLLKPLVRATVNLQEAYASHGYNAIYHRLKGLPSFLLMSIKDIYPGDEILVPYGPQYWEAVKNRNKKSEQKANTKD